MSKKKVILLLFYLDCNIKARIFAPLKDRKKGDSLAQ